MYLACENKIGNFVKIKNIKEQAPTFVVLTTEEYANIKKIKDECSEMKKKEADYESNLLEMSKKYRIAKVNFDDISHNFEEYKAETNTMIEKLQNENLELKKVNENVLRISKERANAKRNLPHKKEHSGYRYSGKISQFKYLIRHTSNNFPIYADTWQAALETPYDSSFDFDYVKKRIIHDLISAEGILNKIHVNYILDEESNLIKPGYSKAYETNENTIYDFKFQLNNERFWEIIINTINAPYIPEDMI